MSRTIRDRLAYALDKRGWREDPRAVTRKYTVMLPPASFGHPDCKLYLGKAGALRFGRTIAESVPWNKMRKTLLEEAPGGER